MVKMGQLANYTIDQVAGALALTLGSIGGLCLILFKSRCENITICWGAWSCSRKVAEEDKEPEKEKEAAKEKEPSSIATRVQKRRAEALMPDNTRSVGSPRGALPLPVASAPAGVQEAHV